MRTRAAVASCLLFSCAGNGTPTVGPKLTPSEQTAEPDQSARSFHVGRNVSLSAPDKDGASIALIGGRRARLHADGRVELESVAAPEPLIGFVEVPGKGGSTWVGASRASVFRFADPLAGGTAIHPSPLPIEHIAAVPDAVAIWREGSDRWGAVDAESGKVLRDITLGGALPARSIAYDSALHGLAAAGSYRFETDGAGASWRFRPAPSLDDLETIYGVAREQSDWQRRTPLEQLKTAPLTARFMVESGEDPLAAAAARGVRASDDTVVVCGKQSNRLARISLQTGGVLASTAMEVGGECLPFAAGGNAIGVACDNGSVYPLELGEHSLVVGPARASGSSGKLIASVGGGIAYDKACSSTAGEASLCVRQANGGFESIPLPPSTLGKSIRPNGSVLLARREGEVIVVERHAHGSAPVRLGEWRACPDARSVGVDELDGGFRLVAPVGCAGELPQYGMFTKIAGVETTEPLRDALRYRMGGGHIVVRAAHEVRVMSQPGAGWQRATVRDGDQIQLSDAGFVAGEVAQLGWGGRFGGLSETALPSPQTARVPKLECKSGALIAKRTSPLHQPPFRGQFLPDSGDLRDVFIGLSTVKGDWLIQWLDTWDLGAAVHELRLRAPGKGEAYVSSVATRGESIVASVTVRGDDAKDRAWVLRRLAGGAVERESIALGTPGDMVLGADGTAAWDGVVWPPGKPKLEFFFPAADDLTLAADAGRAYLFAPRNTLETVVELKGKVPMSADHSFDASLFASAIPGWRDRARRLPGCSAGATGGRLVRITLPAVVEIDGVESPKSELAAEVSWQPGQAPCIARMRTIAERPLLAIVKVDLAASRAELVDLVVGDTKELACRWELPPADAGVREATKK